MRRAATVLTTCTLIAAGTAVPSTSASAADVVPRDLTITGDPPGPGGGRRPAGDGGPVRHRGADPVDRAGRQLVVFAKLHDTGPDGAVEQPHRVISPGRVADDPQPVTIELPGSVHRFAPGYVQQLTLPVTR